MTQDGWEAGKSRVIYVSFLISLGHMDIRAADTAGLDFHKHFLRSRFRNIIFADLQSWVAPDLAAQVGLTSVYVFRTEFETRLGVPIGYQSNALHFAFHVYLLQNILPKGQKETQWNMYKAYFPVWPTCA